MGLGAEEVKNYYFKDELAYTEDNLRVHNLFVRRIPYSITKEEVLAYFEKYGEVVKIHLVAEKKNQRKYGLKLGFVHFATAQSASRVLQKSRHIINSQRIQVKACDSWDQPGAYRPDPIVEPFPLVTPAVAESACSDVSAIVIPPEVATLHILDLNDDCLELIAKNLGLRDQMRMSRTCRRFSAIIEMCSKVQHKIVSFEAFEQMTLWDIREFFLVAGNAIERISGELPYKNRHRIVDMISHNCPNIKSIYLDSSKIKTKTVRTLFANMEKATAVELRDCAVHDSALTYIRKLPKLEVLMLAENYELTGKHLSKLTTLSELDLNGCRNITETNFIEIIKCLNNLQSLNIQHCDRLTTGAFEAMERHCQKLELLRMTYRDMNYGCIARLPALKRFELTAGRMQIFDSVFSALSTHQAHQLEHLKIAARNCINLERAMHIAQLSKLKRLVLAHNEQLTDDCLRRFGDLEHLEEIVLRSSMNITNVGLLNLMRRCTKLRRVNIERCRNISDEFIFKVIELLRQRQKSSTEKCQKLPVLFHVIKTGISEFVLNNAKCHNATSLIKLSFCVPVNVFNREEQENMEEFDYLDDEEYDEYDEIESVDDDDVDFVVDLDDDDEQYHMYDFSDMEDEDYHNAYNVFGRYVAYGNDINDYIW